MYENEQLVPKDAVHLYKMMWQFERWLRLMVYVELYARDKDWEKALPNKEDDKSPKIKDKKLTHMITIHENSLSYLTLGELWQIIWNGNNWNCFEAYFPPKDNIEARIKEVMSIRNRVMHFREPHENDVMRMELFLKDFESGVRLFCHSYIAGMIDINEENSLISLLEKHWDDIGYSVDFDIPFHAFGRLLPSRNSNRRICAELYQTCRPWSGENGKGLLYRLSVTSVRRHPMESIESFENFTIYELNIEAMLRATRKIRDKCIHICIGRFGNFIAIFPAHFDDETNLKTISTILNAAVNNFDKPKMRDDEIEKLKRKYPEYVLFPDHPLVQYDEEITESLICLN